MVTGPIDVIIPTIPPRAGPGGMLERALASVRRQTMQPMDVHIVTDVNREGAARTRQRALERATAPWVAFLDDDDELMTPHLQALYQFAIATRCDYAYSWFVVVGGVDPFPKTHYTEPWDNANPRQTTIVTLVRRELAQAVGFAQPDRGLEVDGQRWGEDYTFTLGCMDAGGKIEHLVQRTWIWHHHGTNTSGMPDRW
jgi:glycosyltransferase involved in cell wall biosynthesis